MAKKQTKRQRKFQATGGVQKRLEKGTISKRKGSSGGNNNKNRIGSGTKSSLDKTSKKNDVERNTNNSTTSTTTNYMDDFMGHENLGNLDVDSFFAQVVMEQNDNMDQTTNTKHPLIDDDDEIDEDNDDIEEDDDDEEGEDNDDAKIEASNEIASENDDNDGDNDDDEEVDGDDDDENNEEEEEDGEDGEDDGDEGDEDDENSDLDDDEDIERMEAQMKRQMKKMQTTDPEFHSFLKENEESLLEYNDTDDDNDDNDEDEDDAEDDNDDEAMDDAETTSKSTKQKQKDTDGNVSNVVTTELLQTVLQNAFQKHSMKSLKKLMNIYKSACYINVNIDSSTTTSKKKSTSTDNINNKPLPYSIEPSSKIYDEIMTICFQKLHTEFQYHLLGDNNPDDNDNMEVTSTNDEDNDEAEWNKTVQPKVLERSERWNDMKQVLLSFYRSTLHLLMEVKELEFLSMICQNVKYFIRYMTPFPRISELFLKTFTNLWSAPIDAIENYQIVRLNAFLRIRQLALLQPFPFIEDCLKKTYLAYMKRAKFGNISIHSPTLPTLTFMGNCLVELYNIDYHSSYQHAFVYIRQLALLLRGVMQKKTIESMQQVYCWQYIQCLKLWVAVLSSAAHQENDDHGKVDMKSLTYPLIEVIMGTIRLIPSPVRHLPFRCQCVRLLHQLAASAELFIPTTSILLDCFDWKEFTLTPKKTKESSRATTRGVQLSMMIKFGKEDPLRTHDQLEASMNELFLLLNREIDIYRYSPGFPEYAIRIIVRLRQLNKEIRNPRWKTYIKACIELCDTYTLYAVQGRSKLQQAPREVQLLECLKPISEKSMYERYSDSIRKEQVTLDAINGVSSTAKLSKKRSIEKESNGEDDHDDDEEEDDVASTKAKKKKRKKKKTSATKSMVDLKEHIMEDEKVMEATDQVHEGINWSDDDDDGE